MIKKNLHPIYYKTKIFCDGKCDLELGTTKKEISVDIWSGNHTFFTGLKKILDSEGRVEQFNKKYKLN